ncbi:RNA methyltransferase [Halobacteriales archaeon QS_8_65_32]|jgi:tRNA C32,U32 (ribose-2'-O)-methylase TrmJ|nr:MAG: RNA methyltransferase [Halobacteriales archaeon QS_8_65_32]
MTEAPDDRPSDDRSVDNGAGQGDRSVVADSSAATITVVVVEPASKGNVGTIARAMRNFGFADLKLVSPPEIEPGDDAYGFAGHAREDVLPNHDVVTFEDVIERFHTIGFTAHAGEDDRRHVRYPFTSPADLAESLARGLANDRATDGATAATRTEGGADADAAGVGAADPDPNPDLPADTERFDAPIALVFGREDTGLSNDELARVDEICSIPASADYPVLNLGQAATIALYELRELADPPSQHAPRTHATAEATEGLYEQLDALLEAIDHPAEKRAKAGRLFRRVFGRARLTGREAATLRGVARRATELVKDRS